MLEAIQASIRKTVHAHHNFRAFSIFANSIVQLLPLHSQYPSKMSTSAYQTAPINHVTVNGVNHAYRLFGEKGQQPPLLMINHFRSNMDHWDPLMINPLAARRQILQIDPPGTGHTKSGTVLTSFADMAEMYANVARALDIQEIDLIGFSIGSMQAQLLALNEPKGFVRRLILAGSRPSGTHAELVRPDGSMYKILSSAEGNDPEACKHAFCHTFFPLTPEKQARGAESWDRMQAAHPDRPLYLHAEGTGNLHKAIVGYTNPTDERNQSFERLGDLTIPVLVANGSKDELVPTENSVVLFNKLPSATLLLYPYSGHGFLDEYAESFAASINQFLDEDRDAPKANL